MDERPVARQASALWVETADHPTSEGHPFFERLNRVLEDCGFDALVEGFCSAFTWLPERLSEAGPVVGKTVGIDATALEANAATWSIEGQDTGES